VRAAVVGLAVVKGVADDANELMQFISWKVPRTLLGPALQELFKPIPVPSLSSKLRNRPLCTTPLLRLDDLSRKSKLGLVLRGSSGRLLL
jgi:hypothetical protein